MSTSRAVLALDIGSNSVGSAWIDQATGAILTGTSVFPAGVDESDDQRGEPKNAKRRMARRTRITLARRAQRKRELKLKLIEVGLLPPTEEGFKALLESTDPWELRRRGLDEPLTAHQFGRVLLHLAQRRGALGLTIAAPDDDEAADGAGGGGEDGKVKAAIGAVRAKMIEAKARTFGEFIARQRDERVHELKGDKTGPRGGARVYRDPVRNKGGSYEHCADRPMIRHEFAELWKAQLARAPWAKAILTDALRATLDDESGDSTWKHKGLLFGQRRQSWDLGTLGRCVLEPAERCAPHADRHASYFRVVETVNTIRVLERLSGERMLTIDEREKLIALLRGPLGVHEKGKFAGRPKRSCSVTDLRTALGWGRGAKDRWPKLNIERDEEREINTDWFHREIVHGAIGVAAWDAMPEALKEGFNRAILRHNPEDDGDDAKLKKGAITWGGLDEARADALVAAWRTRPKLEKRLNMSRKAVRNLLAVMDTRGPDGRSVLHARWVTQIEARKLIAEDAEFRDITTGKPLDEHSRRRYATGAKGLSARDRHYIKKHPQDLPPAPMLTNPVVRKAIHEVRRHIVEYIHEFKRLPDEIRVELAREAKMGAKDADRVLLRNRLRDRIRKNIIEHFHLTAVSFNQQRAAVDRVVLAIQQGGRCPLCGKAGLTSAAAAKGSDCELAHILPRSRGGHNGQGNMVLSHTGCNRRMKNRTPREFWAEFLPGGFEEGVKIVESIYGAVQRPKPGEIKKAEGESLWACYFDRRDDERKAEQFTKDISDTQGMTNRQEAATKYAARQVMAYLADALYGGKGLPERGGERKIFATDGLWTSRLRREWGLFFDPHGAKAKGQSGGEEHAAKEKNRADHRHHAVDAIVIGLCTEQVRNLWDKREREAEIAGINTADEEQMDAYRRAHPIPPPAPFKDRDELRQRVKLAVFGDADDRSGLRKPISHRPVKRKIVGYLHKDTMYGPVISQDGSRNPSLVSVRYAIADLTPAYLRVPPGWDKESLRLQEPALADQDKVRIREKLASMADPSPGPGLVRDRTTRDFLRKWLSSKGLSLGTPDSGNYRVKGGFSDAELRRVLTMEGGVTAPSGVPIRSVVVLRAMAEPVVIQRKVWDFAQRRMIADSRAASIRLYDSQSNHHVELRASTSKSGKIQWKGQVITTFEAAQRKLAKLRAFKTQGVPKPTEFRTTGRLSEADKQRWRPVIAGIERAHPLVNREDDDALGGCFVMSLCEGETLLMKHKDTGEVNYFVVAKINPTAAVVLVPHWDARAAGKRKNSERQLVEDSERDSFTATPSDLLRLAPPGHPHAVKVRVSALGKVTVLERD